MSQIRVSSIKDLSDSAGFLLSTGKIHAIGTLTVSNIVINGKISGNSDYIIPDMSGNAGKFLRAGASGLEWASTGGGSGIRSMQVWTSNGTWSRPNNCKSIIVTVTGAGGGGSGVYPSPNTAGKGGGPGGPYAGAGNGSAANNNTADSALANSGSGGGGGADGSPRDGGFGGSGIVLIAYPT